MNIGIVEYSILQGCFPVSIFLYQYRSKTAVLYCGLNYKRLHKVHSPVDL